MNHKKHALLFALAAWQVLTPAGLGQVLSESFDGESGTGFAGAGAGWEGSKELTIFKNQLRLESGEGTGELKSPEFENFMGSDNRTIRFEFSASYMGKATASPFDDYFFRVESKGGGYYTRLYATTEGVANGDFRLGVLHNDGTGTMGKVALSPSRRYTIVIDYEGGGMKTTVSVLEYGTVIDRFSDEGGKISSITRVVFHQRDPMDAVLDIDNLEVGVPTESDGSP